MINFVHFTLVQVIDRTKPSMYSFDLVYIQNYNHNISMESIIIHSKFFLV